MSELLSLCSMENEQHALSASDFVNEDRDVIEQCIAKKDCKTWFLRMLFKHRHDNDESLCKQIVQHDNCPMQIAAIIYHCKPELLNGSARHAEIKVADLDSSYKAWHKLKKANTSAKNLAEYISATIFKTEESFFNLDESPYSFCDTSEDIMRELYPRTPDIVFEKFSEHPETPAIKAAYQPIASIIQLLPTMTSLELATVARRSDITDEIKQKLTQLNYQSELLTLCTLEAEQKYVSSAELSNADKSTIEQCIKQENCQSWFLDKVFINRLDADNSLLEQILQHNNCPWRIAAIVEYCQPELLEGTQVHAEIQLAHFDPESLKKWDRLKQANRAEKNLEDYILDIVFKTYVYQQSSMRALYNRTPAMVFEKFKDHKKTEQFHVFHQPIELAYKRLPELKAAARAAITKRDDLTDEIKLALAQDSSVLVKKNLLANAKLSNDVLTILSQDVNETIAETALKLLPEELKSEINKQKATADDTLDLNNEKSILAYLRLEVTEPKLLAQIATHASPLLCCAATVHKSADETVWNAAEQRTDLPVWSKIGLAQYSSNSNLIDSLITLKDYSIHRALCDNPHLNEEQAKVLVKSTNRIEIWAAISNKYIDNSDMLTFIINLQGNESLWLSQLRRCLDPNVTSSELRTIHSSSQRRTLVLSRLIARNPKCPIPIMRLYAHYLPKDIALNPSYGLQVIENPQKIKAKPYDDWKEAEYLTQGNGPECVYEWYLNHTPQLDESRNCPRSRNVNPNKLRPMVLAKDSAMHRRFIHSNTQKFSDYEYHMLAYVGTPTLKKNIITSELCSTELLLTLLKDKDRSVVLAAETLAKKRKLQYEQPLKQEKDNKPAKITSKSLGNKAARLSLAKESKDVEIIRFLAQDKLPDVRAQLAERDDIKNDIWLALLNDPDDKVIYRAISYSWYKRELNESEHSEVQTSLKAIVNSSDREDSLRINAMKKIDDLEFIASLYQQGEGEFDEIILNHTNKLDIIEDALFAIERGHTKIKAYWLAENKHLSADHKTRLLTINPSYIERLITNCSSAASLLELYQQHGALIDKYKDSIRFDRLQSIDFSAADLKLLHDEIHINYFIPIAAKDLHKLDDDMVINILKTTLIHEEFYNIVFNENFSTTVQAAMLDMMVSNESIELLSYFAHSYALPDSLIEKYITSDHENIRRAIANYQELNEAQLTILLHDEFESVWNDLFESQKIAKARFPDWFIRRLGATNYDYLNLNDESEPLVIELNKRKISLETIKANSANALIKQFNAKVTVKKFKELLIEKGLMETVTRVIEVDEWDDESDKEIRVNKTINYNRLTPLSVPYGYSHFEEWEEHCTIAYYPETFLELLKLLGISVRS